MGADGSISTDVLLSAFVLYLVRRFPNAPTSAIPKTLPAIIMKIERTIKKYYYLTGDEKSKVGNADPVDSIIALWIR
jgi:hypothetical protein